MAVPLVITGAQVRIYINNVLYKELTSISFTIDYGETSLRGIDSPYAQEIATNTITVKGSVSGLRIKMSGGLQGKNMRPIFSDVASSPYVSIRIQDRSTAEDILFLPQAKITNESHSAAAKSTYKLNFNFEATVPQFALDRS